MGRKGFQRVSQRQYARMLGISNEAISRAIKDGRIKKGWDNAEKKIIVEIADKEFGSLHRKVLVEDDQPIEANHGSNSTPLQLNSESSYADAKRIKEIIHAQMAALDLKERKGELLNKDEVHKQLFSYGQHLRVNILSIPDRIIDNILAAKTRSEAHNLLLSSLHESLQALTNIKLDTKFPKNS